MHTVSIEWRETHHPRDDDDLIESAIGAAPDEGPIIVVPADRPRGPSGRNFTATIFHEVNDYFHHLNRHRDELDGDRFVGVVRSSPDKLSALQALALIQQTLSPGSDGVLRKRTKKGGRHAFDHKVATVPLEPTSTDEIAIESWGEGIYELLHVHPKLRPVVRMDGEDDDES